MLKKISVVFLITFFIIFNALFYKKNDEYKVLRVISPVEIELNKGEVFKFEKLESFDSTFSNKNKTLAANLNLTEKEAFIIGNLAKYWSANILSEREINKAENDLTYLKFSYRTKFMNSAFCLVDGVPNNKLAFERLLQTIRKGNYIIVKDEKPYEISASTANGDFIVLRKSHYKRGIRLSNGVKAGINNEIKQWMKRENSKFNVPPQELILNTKIKLLLTDLTTKLKPDTHCSGNICREILSLINASKSSIDIAIYGYSSVPDIEKALNQAINRGVKIRLVYDVNLKGENIYPDTLALVKLIPQNTNDLNSSMAANIMHNKFYIFDNKIVVTGSANLSSTDMSGFNSNNIIVINSPEVANIYKTEFEQMFNGKFHSDKLSQTNREFENMKIYFSPQDKAITNGVLPIIQGAKEYIYLPVFIITDKRVVEELIKAKNRGVDVKIIVDALNASVKHSKHTILRQAGVPVKTENYAGKMHSKTMIVDDKYLIIGSMNFSNSGENKNDENIIVFNSPESAQFCKKFFLYQWNRIPDKWLKYSARAEGKDSIGSCTDGLDNNYDGLIDSFDPACK